MSETSSIITSKDREGMRKQLGDHLKDQKLYAFTAETKRLMTALVERLNYHEKISNAELDKFRADINTINLE